MPKSFKPRREHLRFSLVSMMAPAGEQRDVQKARREHVRRPRTRVASMAADQARDTCEHTRW